jgi:hypothetical protein
MVDRLTRIEVAERNKSARNEPGTVRRPLGSNDVKYNTAFYGFAENDPLKAWCAVFQWWCFRAAGMGESIFPATAGVLNVKSFFQNRHRYFQTPIAGDLVIWINGDEHHIGFVEKINSSTEFQTIEGNVSSRVLRVHHTRGEPHLDGYCRPEYHTVEENDMTGEQARQLKLIYEGLIVPGTTTPAQTVDKMFNRIKTLEDAINVPGTHTAQEAFEILFRRIAGIERMLHDMQK